MNSGFRRFFAAFSLVALVSVVVAAPSNAATPSGVGSAGGATVIAALDAGDLLELALIAEQSAASLDPAVSTPSATETLSPLVLSSATLPALNAATVPSIQTTSTGDADVKNTALIDLGSVPGGALTGTINPATLSSLVDASGAASALTSTLANVGVLAGVAHIDSASLELGGLAAPDSSTANRQLSVDGVTVLDLRALLNLLGLDLNKLPLSTLTDLIDQLGLLPALNSLTGQNFGSAADVLSAIQTPAIAAAQSAVNTAQTAVNTAQTALTTAQAALAASPLPGQLASATTALNACLAVNLPALCTVQQALVNSLTGNLAVLQNAVTTAQGVLATAVATLNTLLATLNALLGGVQGLLNGLAATLQLEPLLSIEGVQVGATATAADTVANSSALATGAVGDIKLGGIDLGGLDVGATVGQVQTLLASLTSQLSSVLTTISPSLANLVTVELLKKATDVAQNGSYVTAVAGITGLVATVTPPDICSLLSDVLSNVPNGLLGNTLPGVSLPATPLPDLLTSLGSVVPSCVQQLAPTGLRATAVADIPALLNPVTLSAAQASSVANFTVVAGSTTSTGTTPTGPGLPRTGMNETLLLVVGGLLAAAALGLRRVTSS